MAAIDDLLTGAKKYIDKVSDKATEAVEVSRAQLERTQLRGKLKEKYQELGEAYFGILEAGSDERAQLESFLAEIRELRANLATVEAAIAEKGPKFCPDCGNKNEVEAGYCSKCGRKL